jgi:hypothetical protein
VSRPRPSLSSDFGERPGAAFRSRDQRRLSADAIAVMAEDRRTYRPRDEAHGIDGKGLERYLAGELSEELLSVSRQCVRADRKGARGEQDWANRESEQDRANRSKAAANGGVSNAFNVVS